MDGKPKIKVIKKGSIQEPVKKTVKSEQRSKREAARDMVSTVSNWVNDFQARKRDETKLAFEQLFAQRPQPNES